MRYVVALLVLISVLVGCQKSPPAYESRYTPPPPPPPAIPVAIIGDSYTRGSDMGGNGDAGWPVLVEHQLRKQGMNTIPTVGADRGSGYAATGNKGTVFADQIPKAVKPNDRLVVLFGSVNDGGFADDLSVVVQRTLADVKTAAPQARLLVIGPAWVDANPPPQVLRSRDVVKSQAEAMGATFVDPIAEGWFADRPDLIGSDGMHPTDAGHQYLADKIAPLIAQHLPPLP